VTKDRDPRPHAADEPDWQRVRGAIRGHLARRAGRDDRTHLDDLVQEACIRLLRAWRRERVDDTDALAYVIAQRTWVDFIRRRTRWRRLFTEGEEREIAGPAGGYEWGDLGDRLRFLVLAFFDREGRTACRELAHAYFAERDWKSVAEAWHESHAAVRKRWSRCVEEVRRLMQQDPKLTRLFEGGS
jgi:DNA-directed RNA polymerase specialized sigma24 family protein